ncbi:MAG: glycoside hydrolase family 9 protein [Lachnospiraceae bacterium]|nr:glycoside hydrolase family 9 protein [Lachnospiraceae bacterium]
MIYFNQVGYLPDAKKLAITTHHADTFCLCERQTGKMVYEGVLKPFHDGKLDAASGDITYRADFSDFRTAGEYTLHIGNIVSEPFAIQKNAYHNLKIALIRSYYFQRCGCALTAEHAGQFAHACCHHAPAALWDNPSVQMELSGGWHDAGDYGRYVTAAATALAHLLYAFSLFPDRFPDHLNIPESGNGTPDLLNECRYELTWLLKMQRADGGVFHKVSTWRHAPFIMPECDTAPLLAYAVATPATAAFAAITALASHIYAPYDTKFADRLKAAALLAWDFLQEHPEFIAFTNPPGSGTGEYGDSSDRDERFWAAAELFSLTGEKRFLETFLSLYQEDFSKTALGYAATGGFGALSFYFNPVFAGISPDGKCFVPSAQGEFGNNEILPAAQDMHAVRERIRKDFLTAADRCLFLTAQSAYPAAMSERDYHWGSNMTLMNNGILLILGYLFTGNPDYREAALAQLHYLLGCNALGYSYVTGFGARSCRRPHMRTVFADGIDEPIPGFVSGGPNARPSDEPGKQLIPAGTPPMKCYADEYGCYSLNEVTIYWNSPAVFVTAFFDEAL